MASLDDVYNALIDIHGVLEEIRDGGGRGGAGGAAGMGGAGGGAGGIRGVSAISKGFIGKVSAINKGAGRSLAQLGRALGPYAAAAGLARDAVQGLGRAAKATGISEGMRAETLGATAGQAGAMQRQTFFDTAAGAASDISGGLTDFAFANYNMTRQAQKDTQAEISQYVRMIASAGGRPVSDETITAMFQARFPQRREMLEQTERVSQLTAPLAEIGAAADLAEAMRKLSDTINEAIRNSMFPAAPGLFGGTK